MSPDRAQDYPVLAPFRRGERTWTGGLIRLPATEAGPLIEAGLIGAWPDPEPAAEPAPSPAPRRRRRTA